MENFNEEEKKSKKSVLKNLSENKSNNSKVKVLKYIVLIAVLGATYLGVSTAEQNLTFSISNEPSPGSRVIV